MTEYKTDIMDDIEEAKEELLEHSEFKHAYINKIFCRIIKAKRIDNYGTILSYVNDLIPGDYHRCCTGQGKFKIDGVKSRLEFIIKNKELELL